jgi:chromate transporter
MGMTAAGALVAIMAVTDLARERSHGAVFIAALSTALTVIMAATVVGVVLNLAISFVIETIFRQTIPVHAFAVSLDETLLASVDLWALLLSVAAAIAIFRFKVGTVPTLGACCQAGIGLHLVGAMA